ncbi:MAG: hypothetical protein BGO70_01985 [Bacteroidetes bacterium 43-93]|nr:MAG: hypothetical protein BGO70_01985 [Bacteroidetes bacterium 43-93]
MNIFLKLSDPVYFKKFGIRLGFIIGTIGIFLFSYVTYLSLQNHKPWNAAFLSMFVLLSIHNIYRAIRSAKKLRQKGL